MSLIGGQMVRERTEHRASFDPAGTSPASATGGLPCRAAGDGPVGTGWRRRVPWITSLGLAAGYLLFALAVHLRLLDSLDLAVGRAARPGDVWGPVQVRAGRVVNDLPPTRVVIPLVLFTAVLSLVRRSLRPLAVVTVVAVPAVLVTLGTKWVMAHTDPGSVPVDHGSYPSGHTVIVVMVFGLIVLLVGPDTHWGWILPVCMGCAMGIALILASVHPASDVIGAGLLAGAALTGATAARLGQWSRDVRRRSIR